MAAKRKPVPFTPYPVDRESDHGVLETTWDNLGGGWRMECICGFMTCPVKTLEVAGEEMDEHIRKEVPTYGR